MMRIGIDVGGRHVGAALINSEGKIVREVDFSRKTPWTLEELHEVFVAIKKEFLDGQEEIQSIGIGIPGAVDREQGWVEFSNNLPFTGLNVRDFISEALGREIIIENDANCAALGEYMVGNGRGSKNMLLVTVGTGVGGGIIINGEIYSGHRNFAGEVGHHVIVANGRQCNCGNKGCLEAYASMWSLEKRTAELAKDYPGTSLNGNFSGKNIYTEAKRGDELANFVIKEQIFHLGVGVANAVNILAPEKVIISGAVSQQGEYLLEMLNPIVEAHLYCPGSVVIETALLGGKAGLIGAAFLGGK